MAELSSCVKCLRDYKIIESIQMITSAKHDGYILVVACVRSTRVPNIHQKVKNVLRRTGGGGGGGGGGGIILLPDLFLTSFQAITN